MFENGVTMSPVTNPLYRILHWTIGVNIKECIRDTDDGWNCVPYQDKFIKAPAWIGFYRGLCPILWLGLFLWIISPVTLVIKGFGYLLLLIVEALDKFLEARANTPKGLKACDIRRVKNWAQWGNLEDAIAAIGTQWLTVEEITEIFNAEVERLKTPIVTEPILLKEFDREAYDWMTPLLKFAKFVVVTVLLCALGAVACGVAYALMFFVALLVFIFNLNTILAVLWFIVQALIGGAVVVGLCMLFRKPIESFFSKTEEEEGLGYKTGVKICNIASFTGQCIKNTKEVCSLFYSDNCPRITLKD